MSLCCTFGLPPAADTPEKREFFANQRASDARIAALALLILGLLVVGGGVGMMGYATSSAGMMSGMGFLYYIGGASLFALGTALGFSACCLSSLVAFRSGQAQHFSASPR